MDSMNGSLSYRTYNFGIIILVPRVRVVFFKWHWCFMTCDVMSLTVPSTYFSLSLNIQWSGYITMNSAVTVPGPPFYFFIFDSSPRLSVRVKAWCILYTYVDKTSLATVLLNCTFEALTTKLCHKFCDPYRVLTTCARSISIVLNLNTVTLRFRSDISSNILYLQHWQAAVEWLDGTTSGTLHQQPQLPSLSPQLHTAASTDSIYCYMSWKNCRTQG